MTSADIFTNWLDDFIKSGSAAWQNPGCFQKFPPPRPGVSAGGIEFVGDGAFAPEAWVRSASRPYPFFSICVDLRHSRACLKRQRAAITKTDVFGRMARGVCLQRRGGFGCSADARFSCPSGECVSPLASGFQRAGYVASGVVGLRQGGVNECCDAYKNKYR
jgi:hypothetical protein